MEWRASLSTYRLGNWRDGVEICYGRIAEAGLVKSRSEKEAATERQD